MSLSSKLNAAQREMLEGYLFIGPAVLLIGVFVIVPALMSFGYSLTDFSILNQRRPNLSGWRITRICCPKAAGCMRRSKIRYSFW